MNLATYRAKRDSRILAGHQDAFFARKGLSRAEAFALPETARAVLGRQWDVSPECKNAHDAMRRVDDLPCAGVVAVDTPGQQTGRGDGGGIVGGQRQQLRPDVVFQRHLAADVAVGAQPLQAAGDGGG